MYAWSLKTATCAAAGVYSGTRSRLRSGTQSSMQPAKKYAKPMRLRMPHHRIVARLYPFMIHPPPCSSTPRKKSLSARSVTKRVPRSRASRVPLNFLSDIESDAPTMKRNHGIT